MKTEMLIIDLKKSNLFAECPLCNGEFNLSQSILFDGTKTFPTEALDAQKRHLEELQERKDKLKKMEKSATEGAENTSKAVNVGKNLEKVLPTMRDFKWELPDCRFLGDPIDLITFNGLSMGKVDSLNFIEVKSGNAKLNHRQRSIRDAIEDKKVSYKVFK